jgi:hypothetical protein
VMAKAHIKLTAWYNWNIVESGIKHHNHAYPYCSEHITKQNVYIFNETRIFFFFFL